MNRQIDILMIGQPSRFRDSIYLLLASISQIEMIHLVDDIESVRTMNEAPAVIVIDADGGNYPLSVTLKETKSLWPQAELLVLVEDEPQFQAARAAGADILLHKGFRAARFIEAIEVSLSK